MQTGIRPGFPTASAFLIFKDAARALAFYEKAFGSEVVARHVDAAGRLVHVNPHWLGEPSPLALVVPARRQLTPAVRSLRDWLHARFAAMAKGELSA